MPSIGSIRVDFLADVTKFVSGLNQASNSMSRFVNDVAKQVQGIEKTMHKLGTGMTVKVTAPILAMGYASVKAADINGKAMREFQAQGERMQKSLAPIGREIIRAFEQAQPTINAIISQTERAAKAFEALPQPTKNVILGMVALTAAVGPAALALSAVAKLAGAAMLPITGTMNAIAGVTAGTSKMVAAMNAGTLGAWFGELVKGNAVLSTTVFLLQAAGVAATALIGIELGRWLYDQFPAVQRLADFAVAVGKTVWAFYTGMFDSLKTSFTILWRTLKDKLADAALTIEAITKKLGVASPIGAQMARGLGDWGRQTKIDVFNARTPQQELADMQRRIVQGFKLPWQSMWQQMQTPSTKPFRGFFDFVSDDLAKIQLKMQELMKSGPEVGIKSAEAFETWNRTLVETKSGLEDLAKLAVSMNEKYTPEIKKLGKELFDLDTMAMNGMVGRNGLISTDNWKQARTEILAEIEKINTAAAELAKKPFIDSLKVYQASVDQVRSQYLQAYPEIAYTADIERLQKLLAQFREIGDFQTSGMIQAIIDDKELDKAREETKKFLDAITKMDEAKTRFAEKQLHDWEMTFGGKLSKSIEGFAGNVGQAFADMALRGKFAFDALAESFASMMISMAAQEAVSPIFKAFGAAVGGMFTSNYDTNFVGPPAPHDAGGITNRPIFTAGHLAGERRREVIAPLSDLPNLLRNAGLVGGSTTVQINDMRSGGAPVQARESRGPDGRRIITAMIKDAVGGGELDSTLSQRFNLRANPR